MEKTWKFSQEEISHHVDIASAKKVIWCLLFSPAVVWTSLGDFWALFHSVHEQWKVIASMKCIISRHLLLGGRKGHVAAFDWQTGSLACELQLRETVRDVQWLHNETLFAVAQKRCVVCVFFFVVFLLTFRAVYIYDNTGTEIHMLKQHIDPLRLDFLSHHFLLVSVGNAGFLKYHVMIAILFLLPGCFDREACDRAANTSWALPCS